MQHSIICEFMYFAIDYLCIYTLSWFHVPRAYRCIMQIGRCVSVRDWENIRNNAMSFQSFRYLPQCYSCFHDWVKAVILSTKRRKRRDSVGNPAHSKVWKLQVSFRWSLIKASHRWLNVPHINFMYSFCVVNFVFYYSLLSIGEPKLFFV